MGMETPKKCEQLRVQGFMNKRFPINFVKTPFSSNYVNISGSLLARYIHIYINNKTIKF